MRIIKSNYRGGRKEHGFTYIEFIIYISLVTLILTSIIPFAWNIIEGGAKSATQQEVSSNGRAISDKISYAIRNATGINSVTSSSISLATDSTSSNPTVIDVVSGNIRIKKGASSAINLNSQNTTVTSITFTNYSSVDNKTKHIGYTFTIAAKTTSTRQEFNDPTTYESSAEIRSN